MYLAWYDPDRKRALHLKLDDACAAYTEKFGHEPSLVLLCQGDLDELKRDRLQARVELKAVPFLSRNTFYVGLISNIAAAEQGSAAA
jgi:hypothetical protein